MGALIPQPPMYATDNWELLHQPPRYYTDNGGSNSTNPLDTPLKNVKGAKPINHDTSKVAR